MITKNGNAKALTLGCLFFLIINSYLSAQIGKFYSPDEDLSNSLINQVYQDKKGFIWIATENGLNKFDGMKFTIYKQIPEDSTSLKNNYVRTVFEDSSENFWVGCMNGLMKYDWATNSFETIKMYKEEKPITPHVTRIIEAQNSGDIWIATSGQGVFFAKKGDNEFHIAPQLANTLNSNYLSFIFQDSKGNIWIGSENNGLNLYIPSTGEIKSFTAPSGISSNNISSIAEDRQGNIFVGTLTGGLNRYIASTNTFEQIAYKDNILLPIKDLSLSKEDLLYIGTDGLGMKIYNREKHVIEDYVINSAPFDFTKGKVHSILQDKDNNFWLGIFQKGIIFIPGAEKRFGYMGFKSLKNNPIGSSTIMSIHKDREGITWIGTDNDGIYGINEKGEKIFHHTQSSSQTSVSNTILTIYEDSNNDLWIGSYTKGLAKVNRRTGSCEYIPELKNEKIYCISEDNEKNLLIGTYGSGLFRLNLTSRKMVHYESRKSENDDFSIDELSNDWINDILFDKDGLIWIAHYKGVSCYNPQKNTFINYLNTNTILPRTVAYTLFEDTTGKIWVGTSNGLHVFDKQNQSIKSYTTNDGLPNNVICGICEDNEGNNIWISTYFGISKFIISENRFINYYAGDGLQGNEFTRGARFKDAKGKIYFGGIYGITSFYPEDITEVKKELKVLITDFFLFNHAVRLGDQSGGNDIITTSVLNADVFRLTYTDNTFSIEFSALEFSNPERIVYQYMIEEISHDWTNSYPGTNRVTYTNLNPGTYTFKLRAKDHDSYSDIKTIKIIISPPWYQSPWAYAAYAVLSVLFVLAIANYIYGRIRRRQRAMIRRHKEQINEAKLQFFINISHEIRTPMTLIINPLEKLISENKDQKLQKTYVMIYRNAQRILRLINQLMDIRKLDKGQMRLHFRETDLVGFIEDLMMTFEYLAQRKNISFKFIHETDKLNVWIDLNNFDKVLLNILSNAFKYTPDNGHITINLSIGSDENTRGPLRKYFEIVISDNGIGIDKDKIDQIFERFYQISNDFTNSNFGTGIGLHLAKSLVELHHGTISAENREDTQGTRFIVRIPLGSDHLKVKELENGEEYMTTDTISIPSIPVELLNRIEDEDKDKKVKPRTKYKILVVEDEDEIREYIKDELSYEYRITVIENGKKALELALTDSPDLIISDVMMPEMDGITLARKVKQNININHIPIILLTAKSTPENKIEGLDIGADAYISKPFSTELLKSTIANLIENRERLINKFGKQQQSEEKLQKIELKSSDEILMDRIMKIINENLSNPDLSVEMLAANVGMSRVHMHRKLKELTSQSARDFIKGIRLKQAAILLSGKKLTISEVAYATGFSNLSHFSNSFREFYGMSPKEYVAAHLPDLAEEK